MNNTNKKGSDSIDHRYDNKPSTKQPKAATEPAEGYGDKKLDGPNRPST